MARLHDKALLTSHINGNDLIHVEQDPAGTKVDKRAPWNSVHLAAGEDVQGLVELATPAEAADGLSDVLAVTPAGLPIVKPNGTALQATLDGNARGANAVDLQQVRTNATEVASGQWSVIAGGRDNLNSGASSFLGAGYGNQVTDFEGVLGGGYLNVVSGPLSFVGGGVSNEARGEALGIIGRAGVGAGSGNKSYAQYSWIGGGRDNKVEGDYGSICGGLRGLADKYGQFVHASGQFLAQGDAQRSYFVVRKSQTHSDASWYELYTNGSSSRMTIATDTVWTFSALVVGTTQGCGKSFGFRIDGVIENDGGTVTLLASTVTTLYDSDDASYDARALADDANDALLIQVQDADAGGDSVRWVASVQTVEVSYP